jgi:hypothetical protein
MSLRHATLACHVLLIGALGAGALSTPTALRLFIALGLVLPLLLTLRGLARGRRATEQRLAVLLIAYIGGASVEVVAQAVNAPLVSIALLVAALELGLLLAVIRRSDPLAPSARE